MSVHLPRGTRDLLPDEMRRRQAVLDRIRQVFERFAFEPLDTPAFERIETLTGKYGDEGQKLIFKILKRGEGGERGECDQALRYDLTVPLARVVAMNPQIRLPFRRYQVAPVWRADRPAKGRFREFTQCDADIVGSTSPLADAECVAVMHAALRELGLERFTIRFNDRRLLRATVGAVGALDREASVLVAVDKLDKIGREGVTRELAALGLSADQSAALWELFERAGDDPATLDRLERLLTQRNDPELQAAVREAAAHLRGLREAALALGVAPERLQLDPTLARGLDYYTGPVFEVVADDVAIGSIAGGGRYDGLIGMFSGREIPAVGCSFGLDRLLVVLEELGLLGPPEGAVEVLVAVWDDALRGRAVEIAGALRAAGVRTDLFLGEGKLKQQFKYANAKGYPWVVLAGPSEVEDGVVALKDMVGGGQERLAVEQIKERIRSGPG